MSHITICHVMMLRVLNRTISMEQFFRVHKTNVKTDAKR